ncbi:hypothetical protein CSKR_112375 [Clonorchis sinensis]|uniref:Uncharacterized protein n=1 Tax=Clonorchis sinensis TaxID=79923 RepID=A0A419Q428_CLOSI|nr:hypothetical protein CSKR_112375 [Clonorchis sinensis]
MSRSVLRAVRSLTALGPSAIRAIPRTTHFTLLRVQSRAPLFSTVQKWYSSQVDRQFTEVLSKEIKQEKENIYDSSPPKGFSVEKSEGTEILLRKEYSDGVCVEIEVDLAGSVNPEFDEAEDELSEKKEEAPTLEARPDIRIRLVKPAGRSVIFNCSFPSGATRQQASSENSNIPTYSVDSVEMERLPGYFVYTDLFDDDAAGSRNDYYNSFIRVASSFGSEYKSARLQLKRNLCMEREAWWNQKIPELEEASVAGNPLSVDKLAVLDINGQREMRLEFVNILRTLHFHYFGRVRVHDELSKISLKLVEFVRALSFVFNFVIDVIIEYTLHEVMSLSIESTAALFQDFLSPWVSLKRDEKVAFVNCFTYPGSRLSCDSTVTHEVSMRTIKARLALASLRHLRYRNRISLKLKLCIRGNYKSLLTPWLPDFASQIPGP